MALMTLHHVMDSVDDVHVELETNFYQDGCDKVINHVSLYECNQHIQNTILVVTRC